MRIYNDPLAVVALVVVLGALAISLIGWLQPHMLSAIGMPF